MQIVVYNGLNRFRGKIISSRVQAAPPWPQALGRLILCSRLIYISIFVRVNFNSLGYLFVRCSSREIRISFIVRNLFFFKTFDLSENIS